MDIENQPILTAQQLNERWVKCYEQSEQAILKHPAEYKKILSFINEVCFGVIDIDEYFDLALQMAKCLRQMGTDSLFFKYFHEQIDPNHIKSPRFFRSLCLELSRQIQSLNQWRKSRRHLKLIKPFDQHLK